VRHRITTDENCEAVAAFARDTLTPLVPSPALDGARLREMYSRMRLIREFDSAVKDLWKQDFIYGLAHSYVCAEAIAVGACTALREGDYITSTHRGHGHTIAKGGDPRRMMAELMGRASGYNKGKGGSMHIAAVDMGMLGATGIVGSAMPIAVGAGLTARTLGKPFVTVCFHGDGATNQGVWHESINLAAAWKLPVIFLCENNQWAISMPYEQAVGNPSVADRAVGYGIPGVIVDGFNAIAVHDAVGEAAERARAGGGPTLIEARFYRYIGHFVADDESYRDLECNHLWAQYDPITRMAEFLVESGVADEGWIAEADAVAVSTVEDATEFAKSAPQPALDSLYEGLYSDEFMQQQGIGR
jgi:acetoin:2,6-dichlorophenolindophenol oxidoreductase subunit alpha